MIFSFEQFQMSEHHEQELRNRENKTKQSVLSFQNSFGLFRVFFFGGGCGGGGLRSRGCGDGFFFPF